MDGRTLLEELTERTDRTITDLFEKRFGGNELGWAIIALGGYGRKELCPFSDVDILLLAHRKTAQGDIEKALKEMMYPLWDNGYTASYSVRTISQALKDSRGDFFFRTSLMDARFICGSQDLFDKLMDAMAADSRFRNARGFLEDMNAHVRKRHEKYGDASYILEPDIKDGYGGLRDYHCLLWVGKIMSLAGKNLDQSGNLSSIDREELDKAVDHLLNIRSLLHKISGRKNDRLSFEYQEALADTMGYKGNGYESGAELFMKHFHRSALTIKSISEAMLASYALALGLLKPARDKLIDSHFSLTAGRVSFTRPQEILKMPHLIILLFSYMAELGVSMTPQARDQIRNALVIVAEARESIEAKEEFLRIFSCKEPGMALTAMLETGVLERFLPEFESIKGRTQFDVYHTYTTDLHSINTVRELKALQLEEKEIFADLDDIEALYLGAFLHDIGKGYGRPHTETGAPIARNIACWLGLSDDRTELVAFLVRHHLLLPDIAYKRDLSDEKVAIECAQMARDSCTLSKLYLLSVADARATGPRAWDDWKASLLRELYLKAIHSLQRGILRDPMNMIVLEQRWEQLISEVPTELGLRHGGRLWALPQAYILHTELDAIKRHIKLSTRLSSPNDMTIDVQDRGEHASLTIITRDRPGLFAMLTGILTINHLDIVSSKVFTWLDGIAVDEFTVLPPWRGYNQWNKITDQFSLASSGSIDIGEYVSSTNPLKSFPKISSSSEPTVTVDNELSDFFTLIEVHSPRKFGLLFRIARTITSLGLNIHRAFLSHAGDPCTDVFYVVDESGEKITDGNSRDRIIQEILRAI
jgi:[protein-PII] uridylyltransferase